VPYAPHTRIVWRGVFGTVAQPLEEWSFRVNAQPWLSTTAGGTAMAQAWATHLAPRIRDNVRLTDVRIYDVNELGESGPPRTQWKGDTVATGGTTGHLPPQCALAVSLNGVSRFSNERGRFYLPSPAVTAGTAGDIGAGTATDISNSAASFLSAVNTAMGGPKCAVASTKGTLTIVTSVRVGRVIDTIRSRRASLDEKYSNPSVVS
jgi:hypothetical protein